jgi:AcrR family transcriptional regulator
MPTAPVIQLRTVSGPKQARSERTLQRLLAAAEALIKEKGHAAVSIPEIARRAGSSVGGFYARFRDKDELLRALRRHFRARDGSGAGRPGPLAERRRAASSRPRSPSS